LALPYQKEELITLFKHEIINNLKSAQSKINHKNIKNKAAKY